MTKWQMIVTILVMMAGTMTTRFLPFILLKGKHGESKIIQYLGEVLPYAVMGLLIIYCLKNVSLFEGTRGIPEAIAIGAIVVLHHFKSNTLLSIGVGTVVYMFLVQVVF